jgi:hypothetical protein
MFAYGVLLYVFNSIPWSAFFLITQRFGVRLYIIRDKAMGQRVQKRLSRSSHMADGGKCYGISVGYWYFAEVTVNEYGDGDRYNIWMIATTASYDRLTVEAVSVIAAADESNDDAAVSSIAIYERIGSFANAWFRRRNVSMTSVIPRPDQLAIMETIRKHQEAKGHTVVYIYGPTGSGKSMIGVMLADSLGGTFCNTFKPWQPGDTLASLYAEAEPTAAKPLIVAFDEVDAPLLAIHAGIPSHKSIPILVPDKAGWNWFLDEISRGMYPHIILFLTSNRDPSFIQGLDPSYIREGRVDLMISVGE